MGTIALEGIEVYAYHGVYPRENREGNLYIVDAYLETSLEKAARTDALIDTLDYQQVYELILRHMEQPVNLLERLCGEIGAEIMARFGEVSQLTLRLSKVRPLAMEKCRRTYVEMKFRR